MKSLYLVNRDIAQDYLRALREKLDSAIRPEEFSEIDPDNPQNFYLEFKNLAFDIIDKETVRLQKELLKAEEIEPDNAEIQAALGRLYF